MSFPGGSEVKSPPANAGDPSPPLGREDPLEKGVAATPVFLPENPTDLCPWGHSRTRQPARAVRTLFLCSVSPFSKWLRLRRRQGALRTQNTGLLSRLALTSRGGRAAGLSPASGSWATCPGSRRQWWAERWAGHVLSAENGGAASWRERRSQVWGAEALGK